MTQEMCNIARRVGKEKGGKHQRGPALFTTLFLLSETGAEDGTRWPPGLPL